MSAKGLLDLAYICYSNPPAAYSESPRSYFFEVVQDNIQIQVAALGEAESTEYRSWVNGVATVEGGTHIEGLEKAFTDNHWSPKLALIHVIMHDPKYAGPLRDKLCNKEVVDVIQKLLAETLGRASC